jgi:hypothetical protein
MDNLALQAIKRIKQLPVLDVDGKLETEPGSEMVFLHPDSFVADSRITLRELLQDHPTRVKFLGSRIADMRLGESFLPLGLKYDYVFEQLKVIDARGSNDVYCVGPFGRGMPCFYSCRTDFTTVDVAQLPPIGASQFVSTVVEDDGAFLVAFGGPLTVKVMSNPKLEVEIDDFNAAIIPPGSSILMQGVRSMLIRPTMA